MSQTKTPLTKIELNIIFQEKCAEEINTLLIAREEIKQNPTLVSVIDLHALEKKLYIKHVQVCAELVRTEKATLEEVSHLMSIAKTHLGLVSSPELKRIFIAYFDALARQN